MMTELEVQSKTEFVWHYRRN